MQEDTVIKLTNISKTFYIRERSGDSIRSNVFNVFSSNESRPIYALKDINLEIKKGEIFGIIGRNGSGKSTLLKIISGAFKPDEGGSLTVNGKLIRLALGMGFDPNLSARENIYLNGSVLGLSFKEIGKIFHRIINFSELHDFVDTQLKFYSSGMRSRLAFSIAVNAKADIFLMDEFFGGVGDANFRLKSEEVFKKTIVDGRTIVFVSHNLNRIRKHCHRLLLLNEGNFVALGTPEEVLQEYKNLLQKKIST